MGERPVALPAFVKHSAECRDSNGAELGTWPTLELCAAAALEAGGAGTSVCVCLVNKSLV